MGLFNLLSSNPKEEKKSIYDFLKTNILEIPDSRFIYDGIMYKDSGDKFQVFSSPIEFLECEIFNEIEVYCFDNYVTNVFFKRKFFPEREISKVIALNNSLFKIFGKDIVGNGIFTNQEIKDYFGLVGSYSRGWMTDKLYVGLNMNKDDNEVVLSIQGVIRNNKTLQVNLESVEESNSNDNNITVDDNGEEAIQKSVKLKNEITEIIIQSHFDEIQQFLNKYLGVLSQKYTELIFVDEYDDWVFDLWWEECNKFANSKMLILKLKYSKEARTLFLSRNTISWDSWDDSNDMDLMRDIIDTFVIEYQNSHDVSDLI